MYKLFKKDVNKKSKVILMCNDVEPLQEELNKLAKKFVNNNWEVTFGNNSFTVCFSTSYYIKEI